eukprot:4219888-Amphidinium_carterae.1
MGKASTVKSSQLMVRSESSGAFCALGCHYFSPFYGPCNHLVSREPWMELECTFRSALGFRVCGRKLTSQAFSWTQCTKCTRQSVRLRSMLALQSKLKHAILAHRHRKSVKS